MGSPKAKTEAKPTTIDAYLAPVKDDQRAALERLRRVIHAAAPGAEEHISYGLPTFRLDGKALIWFGAAAKHCALYGAVDGALAAELAEYDTSGRGTIRFQPDKPLPDALVARIVRARIAHNAASKPRR